MENNPGSIVITSIYNPSQAIRDYARFEKWTLIVAGDKKSPEAWNCQDVMYLSPQQQENLNYKISKLLPWNHYCRKMLGYLYAIEMGSSLVVDTDDDNIPKDNWGFPNFDGYYDIIPSNLGFINIYKSFTNKHIWPRGFDLSLINSESVTINEQELKKEPVKVGVWQGLADGDPDVDAIYRLVDNQPCFFENRPPIVLGEGTICPFNSQNTAFRSELFSLLYLPALVTFRFTDILRGLVAQPIMWQFGYKIGFLTATVHQERNPHNYMEDFAQEIPVYLNANKIIDIAARNVSSAYTIEDNLFNVYESLLRNKIIVKDEMKILSAWLEDLQTMRK